MRTKNKLVDSMKFLLPSLIVVLMFVACGSDAPSKMVQNSPVSVNVAKVSSTTEGYLSAGSGQITSVNSASLSTRMMGFVERIPIAVGQKVGKGQLLVSIKNADLQAKKAQVEASIIEAKAGFQNAEKDYQRFVNLFEKSSASQKELDDMTSHYEMAKARYEAAQQMRNEVDAQFAYANIRAPFAGVVTNIHIDEGTMANPGIPLISIEAPGSFEVEAKVAENAINQLKVGKEAKVFVKAIDTNVKGTLTELSSSAQFSGGQYIAKVILEKPPANIRSGMFASISFPIGNQKKHISKVTVPKSVIVRQGQLSGIYTVGPENTAILRWLRLGESMGDEVEVLSGLTHDETYIVSAEGKLYNGAKLAIQ